MVKLSPRQISRLSIIYTKLQELSSLISEAGDIDLHFGNGTVCTQLDCALASLDCIYQELE